MNVLEKILNKLSAEDEQNFEKKLNINTEPKIRFIISKRIKEETFIWNEDFGFQKPSNAKPFIFMTREEAEETIKLRNLEDKVTLNNSEFNDSKISHY